MPSSTPSTQASSSRSSTRRTKLSTWPFPRRALASRPGSSTPETRGVEAKRISGPRSPSSAVSLSTTLRNTNPKRRKTSLLLARKFTSKFLFGPGRVGIRSPLFLEVLLFWPRYSLITNETNQDWDEGQNRAGDPRPGPENKKGIFFFM